MSVTWNGITFASDGEMRHYRTMERTQQEKWLLRSTR